MFWLLFIILPYSLILLYSWLSLRPYRQISGAEGAADKTVELPLVSVIVSARNEEPNLPLLAERLLGQDYPKEKYEIILVDNGSSDSTAAIINSLARSESRVRAVSVPEGGKKEAIAAALEVAVGELIMTCDADTLLPSGWIRSFADISVEEGADMIIGPVNGASSGSLLSDLAELEFASLQAVTAGMALGGMPVMSNGASLGFRREVAADYKEFIRRDIASGDDMYLLQHVKRSGGKVVWNGIAGSELTTMLPTSAGSLLLQRIRWASKGAAYRDPAIVITSVATLLSNLVITLLAVSALLVPGLLPALLFAYLLKTIPELLNTARYLAQRRRLSRLRWFLPLSLVYPFYVVAILLLAPFYRATYGRKRGW